MVRIPAAVYNVRNRNTRYAGFFRRDDEVDFSMDINDTIKSQLQDNSIILYMKGSPQTPQCGFSARTVQALMACGERFAYVNILDNQELREALKVYSNWPTYPQLYINGELVGGCDIVLEMSETGELAEMVKAAAAKQEGAEG